MNTTFEEYLKGVHAKNYSGTDDNMPDAFDNWLSQLDGEEYIAFAESYGVEMYDLGQLKEHEANRD